MSLVRLLELGRSLDAVRDTQSRYRMQRQNLLPKFGIAGSAGRYHSLAANAPSSNTGMGHRWGISFSRAAKSGEEPADRAFRIFLSPFRRAVELCAKAGKILSDYALRNTKAIGWTSRKRGIQVEPYSKPIEADLQAELALDNVTVARNDLSDADFQVAPIQPVGISSEGRQSAQLTPVGERHNWIREQITSCLLRLQIGYQDRTGFHAGVMPARKEVEWPPFW